MRHIAHINPTTGRFDRYGRPARFDVIIQYIYALKTLVVVRDLPKADAQRLRNFLNA